MYQVYDVRQLQQHFRMRRLRTLSIFAAGALFGVIFSQTGSGTASAFASATHAPSVTCDGRTTLRLDCGLTR